MPDRINPNSTLDSEISKLKKYNSENLVVGIRIDKTGPLNLNEIKTPALKLGGLWIFGSSTPDQSKWFLYGDLLKEPYFYDFYYPTFKI